MDPEIQRALAAGYTPQQIAQELQTRGLPVPPELFRAPQSFSDYVNAGAGAGAPPAPDTPGGAVLPVAGAGAFGLGSAALNAWGPGSSKNKAIKSLIDALPSQSGFGDASQTMAALQGAGRGDLATLGDLNDELRGIADYAATASPSVRGKLGRIVEARNRGIPARLSQDVAGLSPQGYVAPRQDIQQTAAQQAAWAQSPEGFEGLRQANPILADPKALADELAKPENAPLRSSYLENRAQMLTAGGDGAPSFAMLQGVKRDLDQQIKAAYDAGNGDLGRELRGARSRLFDIMDQQVGPQYRSVLQKYRDFSERQEAEQLGLSMWGNKQYQPADIAAEMKDMSPGELFAFRRGVTGGLLSQIENAKADPSVLNSLQKSSIADQAKLEQIFGSKARLDEFMQRLQAEKQLTLLSSAVGGSQTASRKQATDVGPEEALDLLHPTTAARNILRRAGSWAARRQAAVLEPFLTAQGPKMQELLQTLESLR